MQFDLVSGQPEGLIVCETGLRCAYTRKPAINVESGPSGKLCLQLLNDGFMKHFGCSWDTYIKEKDDLRSCSLDLFSEFKADSRVLSLKLSSRLLKVLRKIFGENLQVRIILKASRVKFLPQVMTRAYQERRAILNPVPEVEFASTKGMNICIDNYRDRDGVCKDDIPLAKLPSEWKFYLGQGAIDAEYYATIKVEVSDTPFNLISPTTTVINNAPRVDFTIVAKDGSEVKCNRDVLTANSPVFSAMFRTACKEAASNEVTMVDMTVKGIASLLTYLNWGTLDQAKAKCDIAFQLFAAGHKYQIPSLEENVKHILMHQPTSWFSVDVAIQLFFVYGKQVGNGDLKAKSLRVLKGKYKELTKSKEYKELLVADPTAAKELRETVTPWFLKLFSGMTKTFLQRPKSSG